MEMEFTKTVILIAKKIANAQQEMSNVKDKVLGIKAKSEDKSYKP